MTRQHWITNLLTSTHSRRLTVLGCLTITLGLLGCQKPTVSITPNNIQVPKLKSFPAEDVQLLNNRFFLWKPNMKSTDVTVALRVADELDEADDYRKFQLKKDYPEQWELSQKYSYGKLQGQIKKLQRDITKEENDIAKLQKDIVILKEELSKTDPSDVEKIKELEGKIADATKLIETKTVKIASLKADLASQQEIFAKLDELKKIQEHWDNEVIKKTDELKAVTEMGKSFPLAVYFEWDADQQPHVRIEKWDVPDDDGPHSDQDRDFTSHYEQAGVQPNIRNVRYTSLGGVWEFDVVTSPEDLTQPAKVIYSFKLGRTKYDDKHGRILYGGDFNRKEAGATRRGSAKLVDRNN